MQRPQSPPSLIGIPLHFPPICFRLCHPTAAIRLTLAALSQPIMEKYPAPSGCKKPTPKQRSSAGAAVARSLAKMAKPRKVVVMVKESGGTEAFVLEKPIRGGEQVLSAPITRFAALVSEEEDAAAEEAQAVDGVAA